MIFPQSLYYGAFVVHEIVTSCVHLARGGGGHVAPGGSPSSLYPPKTPPCSALGALLQRGHPTVVSVQTLTRISRMPDAWQSNLCISLGPARGVARVGRPLQTGSILIYWLGNCLGRSFTAIASRSPEFNTHTRRASVTPVSARGNWAISFLYSFFYRFIFLDLLFPRLPG